MLNAFCGVFEIEVFENRYCIGLIQIRQRLRNVFDHRRKKRRAVLLSGIVGEEGKAVDGGTIAGRHFVGSDEAGSL